VLEGRFSILDCVLVQKVFVPHLAFIASRIINHDTVLYVVDKIEIDDDSMISEQFTTYGRANTTPIRYVIYLTPYSHLSMESHK
jgi:hypothetical protein